MFLTSIYVWVTTVLFPPVTPPLDPAANITMRVIGVGLSRTGTMSTRLALAKLLGGKIYHGYESDMDDRADFWLRAAENPDCVTEKDWKGFLSERGYSAGVGEPVALFYRELAAVYPEAKFLLNTRDPHAWYRSMRRAIIKPRSYLETPPISWIFSVFSIEQNKQLFQKVRSLSATKLGLNYSSWTAVYAGEEEAVQFFNDWHEMIVASVPAEKLVIYNVAEGWGPLAGMLGMEVPQEPFPDVNDATTITLIVLGGYYILVLVIPALIVFCCWRKSARFRNVLKRVYGMTLRVTLGKWRSWRQPHKMRQPQMKTSNSTSKNNNNGEKNYDYIQYSNVNQSV